MRVSKAHRNAPAIVPGFSFKNDAILVHLVQNPRPAQPRYSQNPRCWETGAPALA